MLHEPSGTLPAWVTNPKILVSLGSSLQSLEASLPLAEASHELASLLATAPAALQTAAALYSEDGGEWYIAMEFTSDKTGNTAWLCDEKYFDVTVGLDDYHGHSKPTNALETLQGLLEDKLVCCKAMDEAKLMCSWLESVTELSQVGKSSYLRDLGGSVVDFAKRLKRIEVRSFNGSIHQDIPITLRSWQQ